MSKKFEVSVHIRGVLLDSALPVTQDNLQFVVDAVMINGTSVINLNAAEVAALSDAAASITARAKNVS